jgi:drug/metabolite transporter (DMT)-like permease
MPTNNPNNASFARGYAIALISAVILSTTAIFIRYLTQTFHMPPLVLAIWREVFVVITLVLVLGFLRPALLRVQRKYLPYLVAYGLVLAIFNSFWTLSVALNGAAVSTVLVYCSAGFTALLGWWLLKERLDWGKMVAIVLSLGGCVLVSGALEPEAWHANLAGISTGILSGLGYAAYSLMGRSASQRGLNPWTTLLYTFGFASCFLLSFNLLPGVFVPSLATRASDFLWLGDSLVGWGVLFLLAAGPTLMGYGLYNVSLSLLPSSVANLIVTLEPAFTAVIAYLLFGEILNGVQLGGSAMILAGVAFLRVYESRFAPQGQPEWATNEESI